MENHCTSNLAVDLGRITYKECLELQLKLVELRRNGYIGNTILFLEHDPPVYTIGRKSDPKNWPGIDPVRTGRGGDVTYHSPGQLVVYPIFDLSENGRVDVRAFVKKVENVVVSALRRNGVETYIGNEEPGIWTVDRNRKVASVGMAIDRNVSYHGIAINITPEPLEGFKRISPCGLDPSVMGYVEIKRDDLVHTLMNEFSSSFAQFTKTGKEEFFSILGNIPHPAGAQQELD